MPKTLSSNNTQAPALVSFIEDIMKVDESALLYGAGARQQATDIYLKSDVICFITESPLFLTSALALLRKHAGIYKPTRDWPKEQSQLYATVCHASSQLIGENSVPPSQGYGYLTAEEAAKASPGIKSKAGLYDYKNFIPEQAKLVTDILCQDLYNFRYQVIVHLVEDFVKPLDYALAMSTKEQTFNNWDYLVMKPNGDFIELRPDVLDSINKKIFKGKLYNGLTKEWLASIGWEFNAY